MGLKGHETLENVHLQREAKIEYEHEQRIWNLA